MGLYISSQCVFRGVMRCCGTGTCIMRDVWQKLAEPARAAKAVNTEQQLVQSCIRLAEAHAHSSRAPCGTPLCLQQHRLATAQSWACLARQRCQMGWRLLPGPQCQPPPPWPLLPPAAAPEPPCAKLWAWWYWLGEQCQHSSRLGADVASGQERRRSESQQRWRLPQPGSYRCVGQPWAAAAVVLCLRRDQLHETPMPLAKSVRGCLGPPNPRPRSASVDQQSRGVTWT